MSVFRIIGILLLLALPMGCSQCNNGKEEDQAPSISEIEGVEGDNGTASPQGVVAIELSEADKLKAKQAPEGMVFIKGGCFTMGNDNAQADEKYEHEACLDDFYMDRYEVTQARWEIVALRLPELVDAPWQPHPLIRRSIRTPYPAGF